MFNQPAPIIVFCLLATMGFSSPSARAQAGSGVPVSPSPWVGVKIDVENGCGVGEARALASKHCEDFQKGALFQSDHYIKEAQQRCLKFYEAALRVQNIFCSYQIDVVLFQAFKSSVNKEAERKVREGMASTTELGKANVSQAAVAQDNRNVAGINQAYMKALEKYAPGLRNSYTQYLGGIGNLNGIASSDVLNEAMCVAGHVKSQVPGYLRELLASVSHASAQVTYDSMWKAIRENHQKLKEVKKEAEENAHLAETRNLEVGKVFDGTVAKATTASTKIELPSSAPSNNGMIQFTIQKIVERVPQLSSGSGIIGAGSVFVYQYASGQKITYPEAATGIAGILFPIGGLVSSTLISRYRRATEIAERYRKFAHEELRQNMNMTAMQLVSKWGQRTENPSCLKAAEKEEQCIRKRASMQAYEVNECSISPIERPRGPDGRPLPANR